MGHRDLESELATTMATLAKTRAALAVSRARLTREIARSRQLRGDLDIRNPADLVRLDPFEAHEQWMDDPRPGDDG